MKELQTIAEFVATNGGRLLNTPSSAKADKGIAVINGFDIAAKTAGIILVKSNPKTLQV